MSGLSSSFYGQTPGRDLEAAIEALIGLALFVGILGGILYATREKPDHRHRKDVEGWAEAQRDEWR